MCLKDLKSTLCPWNKLTQVQEYKMQDKKRDQYSNVQVSRWANRCLSVVKQVVKYKYNAAQDENTDKLEWYQPLI